MSFPISNNKIYDNDRFIRGQEFLRVKRNIYSTNTNITNPHENKVAKAAFDENTYNCFNVQVENNRGKVRWSCLSEPKEIKEFIGYPEDFYQDNIAYGNNRLLGASISGHVYVLNDKTKDIQDIDTRYDQNRAIQFSKDGTRLFFSGQDYDNSPYYANPSLMIYDLSKNNIVKTVPTNDENIIYSIAENEMHRIALGAQDHVELIDLRTQNNKQILKHNKDTLKVVKVAYSPDGRYLAAGCANDFINIWDLTSTKKPLWTVETWATIKGIAFHPFISSSLAIGCGNDDKRIMKLNISEKRIVNEVNSGYQICGLSWTTENNLVSAERDLVNDHSQIAVRNGNTLKLIATSEKIEGLTTTLALSRDERRCALPCNNILNIYKFPKPPLKQSSAKKPHRSSFKSFTIR